MDFTRNQTQTTIADMVVTLLAREPADLWTALSDAGVFTMLLPEAVGGDGLGMAEGATVLTELARRAAVGPALATIGYGLVPLARFASRDIVDAAAVPGRILTGAFSEPGIAFPARPSTTAASDGHRLRVTGTKIAVPYAEQAHRMLVATSSGIVLVDPGGDGVRMAATPSSTEDPEYVVEFDSAPGVLVTEDIASYYRLVVAAIGAVADGLAAGAAELTAKHLASRHQFGKPLATFQAVAGEIADVYVTARTVHVAAVATVWQADRDRQVDDSDVLAYWIASELPAAMQMCHHLHGGVGVDVTYPMHRYYSAAKDLARILGGSSYRLDLVGAACSSN